MHAAILIDTDILLYAISTAPEESAKRELARQLLAGNDWGLSVQVLQEFYVNATRPPKPAMEHRDAEAAIRQLLLRPVVPTDAGLLLEALAVKDRFRIAYWDAAIVAAAHRLGAETLYSEDLNHGQDYGGVTVLNPFVGRDVPR